MDIKLKSISIPNFRKLKSIPETSVGKNITVISGHNGVGKSSIMSLISSCSGTKQKRTNDQSMQPEFDEYFYIEPEELFKEYRIFLTYSANMQNSQFEFRKRISFDDYTKSGRGIRALPRSTNNKETQSVRDGINETKEKTGITDSGRIKIPTIYISSSRIVPPREADTKVKSIASNANFIKKHLDSQYKEWYNSVLDNAISDGTKVEEINKTALNKKRITLAPEESTSKTQSVGQDNLGNIISALVDFYNLKQSNPEYSGGILCIDEIEMSLHPNAQIKLFNLLDKLSTDLNLQIFITTHSITILKETIHLQNKDTTKYRLLYFKGTRIPNITDISSYEVLKADLFNELSIISSPVKIYCEDDIAKSFIESLLLAAKENDIDFSLPNYTIIPINLGNQDLKNLPNLDSYFNTVLIMLDGDSKIKSTKRPKIEDFLNDKDILSKYNNLQKFNPNYLALPSLFSPEEFSYLLIKDYVEDDTNHLLFWRNLEKIQATALYSSDKIMQKYLISNVTFKKIHRKKKYVDLIKETHLLTDYYSSVEHIDELTSWIKDLETELNILDKQQKSRTY